MFGIEKYKQRNWCITRVSGRASGQFAIQHVLYPASGIRRHQFELQHKYVLAMVHRLHKIWFRKVKDLIVNKFWCPGSGMTPGMSLLTFRRVMHCRPSCVFYADGNSGKIRPCNRDRFCPWCWARTASCAYQLYKYAIRKARKSSRSLVVTCRVLEHKFAATDFNAAAGYTPEQVLPQAEKLRAVLEQHRAAHQKLAKHLQRKTKGSAWRVTVNPCDGGWLVESRQFFLHAPQKSPPGITYPGATVTFEESVSALDDNAVYDLMGRFFEYPVGLMNHFSELAAVYLQASSNIRTCSGTGVFRATGQSTVRKVKKAKRHGENKNQAKLRAD